MGHVGHIIFQTYIELAAGSSHYLILGLNTEE